MENIDNLSGRELDVAVALELGWRWMVLTHRPTDPYIALIAPGGFHTFTPYGHFSTDAELSSDLDKSYGSCPRYSSNIAAAWELDGVGYTFSFCESHAIGGDVICTLAPNKAPIVQAVVFMGNHKAAAYATARCRAWLKAQQAAGVTNGA